MKDERIQWIDVYRGLGILIMIMGHVRFGLLFDKVIHSFHMPMWFLLSGYLYKDKQKQFLGVVSHKARTLLIPYYINLLCYFVFWLLITPNLEIQEISRNLLVMILGIDSPISGGVQWFLTALFLADCMFFCFIRVVKNTIMRSVIVVILMLLGSCAQSYMGSRLFWSIDAAVIAVGFMYIGYTVRKNEVKLQRLFSLRWITVIGLGIVLLVLSIVNDSVNMRSGLYGNRLLFIVNALIGSIFVVNISKQMMQVKNAFHAKLVKYLRSVGRNSLIYLCMNIMTIYCCERIIESVGITPKLLARVICLIMTLGIIGIAVAVKQNLNGRKFKRLDC